MVALNPTAEELNKQTLAETNITGLGGSDTKEKDFSAYGGLKSFMPDATKMYNAMYGVSEEEQTKQDNIRFGMNMLTFFTQMGAEASKPGATALGAANIAGASTAQQYLKQMENDKTREDKKKSGVIDLASKLATFDAAKSKANTTQLFTNNTDKPITLNNGKIVGANSNIRLSEKDIATSGDNVNLLVPFKPQPKLDAFQRGKEVIDRIGKLIIAGESTPTQDAEYSLYYQQLTKGGERKTYDDEGNETVVKIPGIDLTSQQNVYPLPKGITANDIISKKSRTYGESGKVAGFGSRMLFNEGIIRDVFAKGYMINVGDITADTVGFGTIGQSDEGKEFYNASRNWVAAILRRESGAAISAKEYADGLNQYFPRLGDTREVILQKQALRETATRGFIDEAGDAFTNIYKDAIPFLSYTKKDGEIVSILNPQGYARKQMENVYSGQDFFTKDTIDTFTVKDIQGILKKDPKFLAKIYSLDDLKYMKKVLTEKMAQNK
jgi:hypothetical protein